MEITLSYKFKCVYNIKNYNIPPYLGPVFGRSKTQVKDAKDTGDSDGQGMVVFTLGLEAGISNLMLLAFVCVLLV